VAHLRERGYEAEADALEDKVHVYKMAKDKYTKLCDEELVDTAHPEGDAEVAPSAEDYGKVETITSTQKKILDKVRKMPTGKLASASEQVHDLVKMAGQAEVEAESVYDWFVDKMNDSGYDLFEVLDPTAKEELEHLFLSTMKELFGLAESGAKFKEYATKYRGMINSQWSKFRFAIDKAMQERENNKELGKDVKSEETTRSDAAQGVLGGILWELKNSLKPKKKEKKKEEGAGSGKPAKKGFDFSGVAKTLKDRITSLKAIRGKENVHDDNREKARALQAHAEVMVSAINKSKTVTKLRALLMNLLSNINWDKYKDAVDLERLLKREAKVIGQWVEALDSEESYKQASRLDELRKLAEGEKKKPHGGTQPPPGKKKDDKKKPGGTQPPTPKQQGLYRVTLQVQQELDKLADLIEKRGHPGYEEAIKAMRETGSPPDRTKPDGLWRPGGSTAEALELAEDIRAKHTPKGPKIPQSPSNATVSALQALQANIGKIPAKTKGKVYEKIGDFEITSRDLISPATFYSWMIKTGVTKPLINEIGDEYIKIGEFEGTIQGMANRANALIKQADKPEDKRLYAEYLRALISLKKQFGNIVSFAAKQYKWPEANVRAGDAIHVKFLGMSGGGTMPGQPGQPGKESPFGQIAINESGQMAAPMQIEFISGGSGKIGAGFPAKDFPPISRRIDLSNRYWWRGMPEKHLLDYNDWSTSDAASQAGLLFGSAKSWPQHIKDAIGQSVNQNPAAAQQLYGYAAKAAFLDFLQRLGGQISAVYSKYNDSVKNPNVRNKLVARTGKDAQEWIRLITQMASELRRGMKR
jgi:hypothetical protein